METPDWSLLKSADRTMHLSDHESAVQTPNLSDHEPDSPGECPNNGPLPKIDRQRQRSRKVNRKPPLRKKRKRNRTYI